MNRKQVLQKLGIVSLFLLVFLAGLIFSPVIGRLAFPKTIGRLNVSIYPKNCTLYKGETETFFALVLNGSGTYEYEWAVNGSIRWHEALFEFGFEKVCKIVVLSVFVRDSEGNWGYATEIVYDPVALSGAGAYSLDVPIPVASYYIGEFTNSSAFAVNGSNWECFIVSTNITEVIEDIASAIDSSGLDGLVTIASGDYDFGEHHILLPDYSGCPAVVFQGESLSNQGVVFKGNGSMMIHVTTGTDDYAGMNGAKHHFSNIKFEHYTPNNDAHTLMFNHSGVELDSIWVQNKNVTRQGTAIEYYGGQGITGSNDITNTDVVVAGFGTGLFVSCDHILWENPMIYGCDDYQLYWQYSAWGSFQNLQIIHPDGTCNRSYPLYFDHLGQGNSIFDVNLEGSGTTMEVPFITVEDPYKKVHIYGFYSNVALNASVPFWNRTDTGGGAEYFVYLDAHVHPFLSQSGNSATVANDEVIAHGCIDFWYGLVTLKDVTDITAGIRVGIEWANASHFRVGVFDDGGGAHAGDDVDIYWFVDANRDW